jgi:hypothetical protein
MVQGLSEVFDLNDMHLRSANILVYLTKRLDAERIFRIF